MQAATVTAIVTVETLKPQISMSVRESFVRMVEHV